MWQCDDSCLLAWRFNRTYTELKYHFSCGVLSECGVLIVFSVILIVSPTIQEESRENLQYGGTDGLQHKRG